MLGRLRRFLALVVVVAALLAVTAMFKRETCSCSTGLPYGAIASWSGIVGVLALASYVAVGFLTSRQNGAQ
jgi:hypothetical protein